MSFFTLVYYQTFPLCTLATAQRCPGTCSRCDCQRGALRRAGRALPSRRQPLPLPSCFQQRRDREADAGPQYCPLQPKCMCTHQPGPPSSLPATQGALFSWCWWDPTAVQSITTSLGCWAKSHFSTQLSSHNSNS